MKKKAADGAVDRLRAQILGGELDAGVMLQGERELAEHLGVSRLTLRSALTTLQAEGLIEKVHGSGNRVLDFRENGGIELVAHLVDHSLEEGRFPLDLLADLLELRRLIAAEVLGLVTERATSEQLLAIERKRQRLDALVDDAEGFMEADLDFAREVVRATNNMALELLSNTVLRMLRRNRGYEAAFGVNSRATLATYDKLIALVRTRDADRVRRQSSRLFARLDKRTLDRMAELAMVFSKGKSSPLEKEVG